MTSKEALKNICLECEKEKGKNKIACPFRSISNDYCEEYEKIKKDLEVLAMLKNYLYYDNENHFIKMKPTMATHCVKEEQLSLFECMMNNEEKEE